MAKPGQIVLFHLSASTDGIPIVVAGTTAATATLVHTSNSGELEIDLAFLELCNTDVATDLDVGVVVYTGTPADPTNVVWKGTIVALSGRESLQQAVGDGKSIGVWCATASKITVSGKVGRATIKA